MKRESIFKDIENKRVLITGASGEMGASMAKLFASYGACVGLHYSSGKEEAINLLKEIRDKSGKAELFQGNLLEQSARENLVKSFVETFGGIDVLINNAGARFDYVHFSELDEKSWDNSFGLNVKAPFYLSSSAFQYMQEKGGGRIINISSITVKYGGSAKTLHYAAPKAALESLTRAFAREGAKYNILVNSIRPGIIDTQIQTKGLEGYTDDQRKERINLVLLKRVGQPIDVARMALFLASESGNYITGEIFTVAGGD